MMEAVYFGTYALFFAFAVIFFILSFMKLNTLTAIVFPVTSAVIWSALAVLSFTIYTDTTTVWNQWAIAPICGVFAFTSAMVASLNVFDTLRQASEIKIDE